VAARELGRAGLGRPSGRGGVLARCGQRPAGGHAPAAGAIGGLDELSIADRIDALGLGEERAARMRRCGPGT